MNNIHSQYCYVFRSINLEESSESKAGLTTKAGRTAKTADVLVVVCVSIGTNVLMRSDDLMIPMKSCGCYFKALEMTINELAGHANAVMARANREKKSAAENKSFCHNPHKKKSKGRNARG